MSTSFVRPAAAKATVGRGVMRQRLKDQLANLENVGLNDCARVSQDTRDARARRWAMFSEYVKQHLRSALKPLEGADVKPQLLRADHRRYRPRAHLGRPM